MTRGQVWVGASLFALLVSLALASCTDSEGGAIGASGAAGAAGALDSAGGASTADKDHAGGNAGSVPASYADAGAPGAFPVCKTTQPSQCEIGEALVTSRERYCPYCRSCTMDEKNACPPYTCGASAHNERAPGQCCSSCVPDDPLACATEQEAYAEQRQPILDQYLAPCKKDADCASALLNTPCEQACLTAVANLAPALVADLAALGCPACPLQPPVSLRPGGHCLPPSCVNGACTLPALATK